MANSTQFERYDPVWFELFMDMYERPDEVMSVPCPDPKTAKALRLEFYRARDAWFVSTKDVPDPKWVEALQNKEVRIVENTVVFSQKSASIIGRLIAESREQAK